MNQTKVITWIILVILIVGGWISLLFTKDVEDSAEYKQQLELAEEYYKRGLYQKSIIEYEQLLNMKQSEENWSLLIQAYDNRYKEEASTYRDYVKALQNAIAANPENSDYIATLANLYMEEEGYKDAYKLLEKADEAGIEDSRFPKLKTEARYAYNVQWNHYDAVTPFYNGYCTACTGDKWIYLNEDGSPAKFKEKNFISAVGEDGLRIVSDDKRTEITDEGMVVQGLLDFMPDASGSYSEGLAPILKDTAYSYYNTLGDKQFGNYEVAGSFSGGKAAVCESGRWELIDVQGKPVSAQSYADIKLGVNGSHLQEGIMLAKEEAQYMMYDAEQKALNAFACDDIDIVTEDGLIAYAEGDKWGFVDRKGEVRILPQYKKAKSFSNGLAAVFNGSKWGFIDTTGTLVIDYQFDDASYFNAKGYCFVITGEDVWQLISLYIKE